MVIRAHAIESAYEKFSPALRSKMDCVVDAIVTAKREGHTVVACIGGADNVYRGVTTLIAELMHRGIVDGVCTTAAVVGHELAGVLEKVKRINGTKEGIRSSLLHEGEYFDVALLSPDILEQFQQEIDVDISFYRSLLGAPGDMVTRAAGNGAYPSGLRTEMLSKEILALAAERRIPFEQMAGYGADPMTMIGAGARLGIPVIVAVSQLVGSGGVGLSIGDSIPVSERARRVSKMMGTAKVVLQSAPCFAESEHDPCEVHRGCGIWAGWQGKWTWSLAERTMILIEEDIAPAGAPGAGEAAPLRRDMTIRGDSGIIWSVLAGRVAASLGIRLEFMTYGASPESEAVREWIVNSIHPADRNEIVRVHHRV